MAVSRHQAGCAYSSVHGLVISGGCSGDCVAAMSGSDTVERTLDGVNLENLPEMPSRMYRHCLVDLGDGDLFVTGYFQPADIGWPTGNGKKLSCSQAQMGQATCLAVA